MRTNQKPSPIFTHEGAIAKPISTEHQLRRSVLSCLLWESTFYESGKSISDRIVNLSGQCDPEFVAQLAVEARTEHNLRHVSLLLLKALFPVGGKLTENAIYNVINRPDEMAELISMYWKDGKKPLPNALKRGLARAFTKFEEYQLSKWNKDYQIKLRDVMFLVHPKPKDSEQEKVFKKLANKELSPPNTWESRMSGGQDKKEVFTDLLQTNKLGYLALLRNLRGMLEAGVDEELIKKRLIRPSNNILPFRFIAAAKHAPSLEPELDRSMLNCLEYQDKMLGKTIILVDVSESMDWSLSSKSDLKRLDAANGLAILLSGICDNLRVFTFSNYCVEVAPRKGMALADAIKNSQHHCGTDLIRAINFVNIQDYDRLIVITDEQASGGRGDERVPNPKTKKSYMINVACYENGVGYGPWVHIDGFSESCVKFIQEHEKVLL